MQDLPLQDNPTFVLDNGAFTAKAGFTSQNQADIIPNYIVRSKFGQKRTHIGSEINENFNKASLTYQYGFERGYLLNWSVQNAIWQLLFNDYFKTLDPSESNIIITEPHLNPKSISNRMLEVLFEEYGFNAVYKTTSASLSAFKYSLCSTTNHSDKYCMIVESGFSFSHIIPFLNGCAMNDGLLRIQIGGKLLTNYLKEVLSYRQLNVMHETCVVNQLKEDACFVSLDYGSDISRSRMDGQNGIRAEYLLPDFVNSFTSELLSANKELASDKNYRQKICMNIERFCVPELLFNPNDVDIKQDGISNSIIESASRIKQKYGLYASVNLLGNIVLTGGNCKLNGIQTRVANDIRKQVDDAINIEVLQPSDPITYAWSGAVSLANTTNSDSIPNAINDLLISDQSTNGYTVVIYFDRV
ncbi:hypothetical protein GJ496_003328 [Pomphorhynchus laevis]|nr:hypothetical protein GJ496_003328 [Pomphorhynchus laevis]